MHLIGTQVAVKLLQVFEAPYRIADRLTTGA